MAMAKMVVGKWMMLIALLATALLVAATTKEKAQTTPKPKGPKHPLTSIPPRE